MKIAIVGAGNVGGALGARLIEAGHDVRFAVRAADPELSARFGEARVKPLAEAVSDAEVVFLAVPGGVVVQAARSLGSLDGKILVDCTNPIRWDAGPVWTPPAEGSNAAALAAAFPNAHVVKAFNQFGAETHADPKYGARGADVFLAGDSADAKARVAALTEETGFVAVDAGPLRNAAVLENVAVLWIHLATVGGVGRSFVLARVSR
jgi:hypothetical protein